MKMNEYQEEAARTRIQNLSRREEFLYTALGLAGEVGEYVDNIKHELFHGWNQDKHNSKEELGDILWYVSQAAWANGFSLEQVAQANVEKLRTRYPEGFDATASQKRQKPDPGKASVRG